MASSVENSKSSNDVSTGGLKMENKPDWVLAKEGIKMLINNQSEKANQIFLQKKDSLVMYAGYAISVFMDALMTLEEEKLTLAISVLKDVEKRCTADYSWLKSVKFRVFGNAQDEEQSLMGTLETQIILADSLVCLAILTFMQQDISGYFKGSWVLRKSWKIYQHVYDEILQLYKAHIGDFELPDSLSQQTPADYASLDAGPSNEKDSPDIECYDDSDNNVPHIPQIKNGYIVNSKIPHSHSAYLRRESDGSPRAYAMSSPDSGCHNSSVSTPNSSDSISVKSSNSKSSMKTSGKKSFLKKSVSMNSSLSSHLKRSSSWGKFSPFPSTLNLSYFTSSFNIFSTTDKLKMQNIDKETIVRLMSAVTFGYGLFQLGISLLPPSLLKFTNLLGFNGNRKNGTSCLMYARLGVDMRAPLATLSLLWYYTIVRPFYALDGTNIKAGVDYAQQLIQESEEEFGKSALFLFFKGRVRRLQSEIPGAIASFQLSITQAKREIRNLSLHEVGWCYLIQLDFKSANETFSDLKVSSRWSRPFYMYLSSICSGCYQNCKTQLQEFKQSAHKDQRGVNQLDEFLSRRANCCPSTTEDIENVLFWKLLVYEMLYLWNAMPSCNRDSIKTIIEDCEAITDDDPFEEPMRGLSKLILGSAYCLEGDYIKGMVYFRKCLDSRSNIAPNAADAHISAFAQYELGYTLMKSPETKEEGRLFLSTLNHYKDYDFEQRLNVRVHSLLKHA